MNSTTNRSENLLTEPKLFCSRGFNSNAIPTNDRIGETVTQFTQIASIDVNTENICNPKILLDVSTFISSNLVRSETLSNGRGDVTLIFRISKYSNCTLTSISPNYVYSTTINPFNSDSSLTTTNSNSFEFQFCDHDTDECVTYIVEYYATLLSTGISVPSSRALISLTTSISNITISALVFDSHS